MAGEEKRKEWWQLKRIWFGFWLIISIIAFGIAQPLLWRWLFGINPPEGATDIANLLLIVITLFALGLTGFSVLIYEALQERLSTRITQEIKQTEDDCS
jgi:polyferredoxin